VVRASHPYNENCRPGTPTSNTLPVGSKIYKLSGWSMLKGVTGGADPLKVVVPAFTTKVKVIKSGELDKAVTLKGIAVTKGAREVIEKAGGKIEE